MEEYNEKNSSNNAIKNIYEWLDAIVFSVVIIILIFTFLFRIVGIKGESMMDTLQDRDRVIISNFLYKPSYGDVVVISRNYENKNNDVSYSEEPIIKRVIATEGQTISINSDNGQVRIDGKLLKESYIRKGAITRFFDAYSGGEKSIKVKKGHVFVMGDNRENSRDSRDSTIGQVDTRYILGKAYCRIFPFNAAKWL